MRRALVAAGPAGSYRIAALLEGPPSFVALNAADWPADMMVEPDAGVSAATHHAVGAPGAWTLIERPVPAAPPALTAGVEAVATGWPPGATVRVIDPATEIVNATGAVAADGTLALTLPQGPWRIEVAEAFPWRAASFDVEVAPA